MFLYLINVAHFHFFDRKHKKQDTDEDDDDEDHDDGTGNVGAEEEEQEQSENNNDTDEEKEDKDTADHDEAQGDPSNMDNDNDADGGNDDGSARGGASDDWQDGDDPGDKIPPGQYYVRTRSKRSKDNTKGETGNNSSASPLGGEISLLDICMMEKKSKYPHVPQLELPFIWDETPTSWSKMYKFDDLIDRLAIPVEEPDEMKLSGVWSQGTYNEWFEESLIAGKDTTKCSAGKSATMVLKEISERRAMARQRRTISGGPECSGKNNAATVVSGEHQIRLQNTGNTFTHQTPAKTCGTTSMEQEATKSVIWDVSPLSHARTTCAPSETRGGSEVIWDESRTTCAPSEMRCGSEVIWDESPATASYNLSYMSQAKTPTTQETTSTAHATTCRVQATSYMSHSATHTAQATPSNAQARTYKVQATSYMSQAAASSVCGTSELKYSKPTLQSCPPPSPAQAKRHSVTAKDLADILKKVTPPSNRYGLSTTTNPATDQAIASDVRKKCIGEGYCDPPSFSLGPEFDSPIQSTIDSAAALCEAGDELFEQLDADDLVRACIEAERQSKLKEQQNFTATVVASTSDFETPAKQTIVQNGDSVSDGTNSSSSGNKIHARRIINPPAHMQSYVDDGCKKHFVCTPEINKLYALVILHGGRNTRSKQDFKRYLFVLFCSVAKMIFLFHTLCMSDCRRNLA